jgi:hypothetical protein
MRNKNYLAEVRHLYVITLCPYFHSNLNKIEIYSHDVERNLSTFLSHNEICLHFAHCC